MVRVKLEYIIESIIANRGYAIWYDGVYTTYHQFFRVCINDGIAIVTAIILCVTALYYNRSKPPATTKYLISNARHTVRDGDGSQAATIDESPISNARHTVWYGDGSQTATIIEGMNTNAHYAVWERDGCQTATTIECTVSYARYAVRDGDRSQAAATRECILSNARHVTWNRDGGQSTAIRESAIANARYAIWDSCAFAADYQCVRTRLNDGIAIITTVILCIAALYYDR